MSVGKTKMMVSGMQGDIVMSKTYPCEMVESNAVCCTQCTKWMHGICTKMKKITCSSARHFVCTSCTDVGDGTEEPVEV